MSDRDRRARTEKHSLGFTLTELLIALAIVAILVSVAIPTFDRQREKARVYHAAGDIALMSVAIKNYEIENRYLPASLGEVGYGNRLDPWGRPYEYLNLASKKGNGQARKDKKLAPLNSDFDLYSSGKDGLSQGPLNAKVSRDDVVRARDGKFIGLATDFDP
jgi:general secretion pathway protein G